MISTNRDKANQKMKRLEDFLEAENIKNYFCTGDVDGLHFCIVNGPVERLLSKALEGLYEEDPAQTMKMVARLVDRIKAQYEAEIESKHAIFH